MFVNDLKIDLPLVCRWERSCGTVGLSVFRFYASNAMETKIKRTGHIFAFDPFVKPRHSVVIYTLTPRIAENARVCRSHKNTPYSP